MRPTNPQSDQTLGVRLNRLIERRNANSPAITNDQIAAGLKQHNPTLKVSGAYLSAIRTGKRTNPSRDLLNSLAHYFDVPLSYLLDPSPSDEITEQMRQHGIASIALRAQGLDKENLSTVMAVLDHVRRLQGLPPIEDSDPPDGAHK